jgi:hypothetical protein
MAISSCPMAKEQWMKFPTNITLETTKNEKKNSHVKCFILVV